MSKLRPAIAKNNPAHARRDILAGLFHDRRLAVGSQQVGAILLVEETRPRLSVRWLADKAALSEGEVKRAIRQLHQGGHLKAIASCWPPEEVAA